MPITIDGDGTITGVSVGGLPDGIVDADMLASNAVTTAKISDSQVTEAKLASDQQKGLAKAWVNFDGTGTVAISDSFNVSSITDNSAGNYTVTMTNALANANYCLVVGGNSYNPGNDNWTLHEDGNHTRTTTTFRLFTNQATSSFDSGRVCAAVFGG